MRGAACGWCGGGSVGETEEMGAGPLVVQMLGVLVGTVVLLHRYGDWRRQHPLVALSVLVGWYFAFLLVFLLPTDVSNTFYRSLCGPQSPPYSSTEAPGNSSTTSPLNHTTTPLTPSSHCSPPAGLVSQDALLYIWRVVYWTSQALTWLVLPVMQSYANAGDFSPWGKVKTALYENALFYGSYLLIFGILIVYVAVKGISRLDFDSLKTIGITASNTWGMILLVFLLGYGLVEIPRQIFNAGTKGYRLEKVYFDIEKLSSEKNDAEESVREAYRDVEELEASLRGGHPFRARVQMMKDKFPARVVEELEGRRGRRGRGLVDSQSESLRDSDAANLGPASEKALVRLHRQVIVSLQALHRTQAQWAALVRHALHLEEVVKNENMPIGASREFVRSFSPSRSSLEAAICTPTVEWYWECRCKRPLLKVLAVLMAIMTAFIVWSECTFFSTSPTLSIAAIFVHKAAQHANYVYIHLSSLLVILYMSLCAYYTVFRLKIYSYYHLDPNGQTDANSLLFAAMLLCRLTPPLSLNFLGMIHLDSHVAQDTDAKEETAFTTLMGHLDLVPFISSGINVYFPIAILLLCLGTYFRLGTRLLHQLGIEQFLAADDDMTAEMVQGGKALLLSERNKLSRQANRADRHAYFSQLNSGARRATPESHSRSHTRLTPNSASDSSDGDGRALIPDSAPTYDDTTPIVPQMERSPSSSFTYGSSTNPQQGIFDDL